MISLMHEKMRGRIRCEHRFIHVIVTKIVFSGLHQGGAMTAAPPGLCDPKFTNKTDFFLKEPILQLIDSELDKANGVPFRRYSYDTNIALFRVHSKKQAIPVCDLNVQFCKIRFKRVLKNIVCKIMNQQILHCLLLFDV